jgi:hypothetical protein
MGMARGGLVRGYAGEDGSHVGGGMPAEEPVEVVEEDQWIISDAIDWAQENPAYAAEMGLMGLLTLAAFTPVGAGAALIGGGTRGAIWAAKAARALGPKVMKFIRSAKPVARATKKAEKKLGPAPSNQAMRNAYGGFNETEMVTRPNLINKLAKGYRRKDAAKLGLAGLGAASLLGGEDEETLEPQESEATALPVGGGAGGNVDPSTYAAPGSLIGSEAPQEYEALSPDDINPPGFFDNISNAGWMGIINAGLNLAAPQGDSQGFGQDLANAAKAGLGTFTEQTASDRAWTNDELDRDIMREQVLYDISQRGLDREAKRAAIAASDAQAASWMARAGERMTPSQAFTRAKAYFEEGNDAYEPYDVNKLARYYEEYGPAGLDLYRGESESVPKYTDPGFFEAMSAGWFG